MLSYCRFYRLGLSSKELQIYRKIHTRKKALDPAHGDEIPVHEFAAKNRARTPRVYVCGLTEHGALGIDRLQKPDDPRNRSHRAVNKMLKPIRLAFAHSHPITDVSCGYGFTLFAALGKKTKEKMYGCGLNSDSQVGHQPKGKHKHFSILLAPSGIDIPTQNAETKVTAVAAGRAHSVALTDTEGAFTFGNNAYGQCGRRVIEGEVYTASNVFHHIPHLDGKQIRQIEAGQDHSLFITEDGAVYSCGWGADGQTGHGNYSNSYEIQQVIGDIQGENITKVSSTVDCVLALSGKGEVFGWGNSEYGQLSHVTNDEQLSVSKHVKLTGLGKIIDIAACGSMCAIVSECGSVHVWGYGMLGKGPEVERITYPSEIPPPLFGRNELNPKGKVSNVYPGINHMMAKTNNGDLFAWGKNRCGELGLGVKGDQSFPLRVSVPGNVVKVSCGADHTVILTRPHID